MADISHETVLGKLNRVGYDAFIQALRQAKTAGNRNVELAHWLAQLLRNERSDLVLTADHFKLDRGKLSADIARVCEGFRKNETEMPGISNVIVDLLDRGWHYATLFFGETQIRSGHILLAAMKSLESRRVLAGISAEFAKVGADALSTDHRSIWRDSEENNLRPMDGSGLVGPAAAGDEQGTPRGTTALDRFAQDLTAKAASGAMDPVVGREEEIRQIVDVLMRRRQNNPILTGEAGVGKTAVVEGLAQRIATGDVPPGLQGVRLCALDIGLMQAGASMKGEFEQRLRAVIDEVQSSPTPVILFIDEAHTLIGAGGQAGTGDAANLLKPPLARGTLRTVAATTWAEYRQYIEKDPALTRRFQPVQIDEPDVLRCCDMMRGLLVPMEKHHGVRIADEAMVAAVTLSQRYIPARQLPDKAVSLLDTACARVAISQSTQPAAIEDLKVAIAGLEREGAALNAESDLGKANQTRLSEIERDIADRKIALEAATAAWQRESALVQEIRQLREDVGKQPDKAAELRDQLDAKHAELAGIDPEERRVHAHVDAQTVAAVVADWTGIPLGKMVRDEIQTVLNLANILGQRVVGQSHGLQMIAKRIETNRAKLDNPGKPVGVFMLCGPSGVGKTETALTLAEALYGGEQNLITINMSEFQEAHTVSTLKGAPPGYVGYGEGGRLTEAVRRKPYSVVLLDEIEKAHPDVHELFFQVFDKGIMEDGTGRRIDFRNTLILLTSNVGTDAIIDAVGDGANPPEAEELAEALKPHLLRVFPPALLGRIVTIPYYPLSGDMLAGIVRLKLDAVAKRMQANHGATLSYGDDVLDHIVTQGRDPDSGARMIDNIITNAILPALAREVLNRSIEGKDFAQATIVMRDGKMAFDID
jgi:type VI secretion system protein VasG